MGYVRDDKPDLFLSYARADDQDDNAGRPGWVTTLAHLLRKEVDRKLGKVGACDLWMDHRLTSGEVLDASLEAGVRDSATMLIVLSPGYLKSDWCGREMELFLKGGPRRVFVIETDRVKWPEAVKDLRIEPFWIANPDDPEETILLGDPTPDKSNPDHRPFFRRLNRLAYAIAVELKRLKPDPTIEDLTPASSDVVKQFRNRVTPGSARNGMGWGTRRVAFLSVAVMIILASTIGYLIEKQDATELALRLKLKPGLAPFMERYANPSVNHLKAYLRIEIDRAVFRIPFPLPEDGEVITRSRILEETGIRVTLTPDSCVYLDISVEHVDNDQRGGDTPSNPGSPGHRLGRVEPGGSMSQRPKSYDFELSRKFKPLCVAKLGVLPRTGNEWSLSVGAD